MITNEWAHYYFGRSSTALTLCCILKRLDEGVLTLGVVLSDCGETSQYWFVLPERIPPLLADNSPPSKFTNFSTPSAPSPTQNDHLASTLVFALIAYTSCFLHCYTVIRLIKPIATSSRPHLTSPFAHRLSLHLNLKLVGNKAAITVHHFTVLAKNFQDHCRTGFIIGVQYPRRRQRPRIAQSSALADLR